MNDELNGAPSQETAIQEDIQGTENQGAQLENTNPEGQQEAPKETLKIKYNHEEREVSLDEARELAQKGLNYEKAIERTKAETHQQARDSYIAEQGYEWNGVPIKTEAEYKVALAESQRVKMLEEKGYDPEDIKSIINDDPDIKWARQEKQRQESLKAIETEFTQLQKDFPEIKTPQDVPQAVIEISNERKCSLSDAMARYENQTLKSKLNDLTKGAKTQEANLNNATTATGSVTGNGSASDTTLTDEVIEAMSDRQRASRWGDIKKHYGMK